MISSWNIYDDWCIAAGFYSISFILLQLQHFIHSFWSYAQVQLIFQNIIFSSKLSHKIPPIIKIFHPHPLSLKLCEQVCSWKNSHRCWNSFGSPENKLLGKKFKLQLLPRCVFSADFFYGKCIVKFFLRASVFTVAGIHWRAQRTNCSARNLNFNFFQEVCFSWLF